MDYKEIYDAFFEIEDKFDLLNKKINGIYFWERIRHIIIEHVLKENLPIPYPFPLVSIEWKIQNLLGIVIRSFRNILFKNPFLSTKKDILLFGFPRRKLKSDGKWWDIFNDPIIENLNYSYELIENYYGKNHLKPPKTQNIRYLDFVVFLSVFKIYFRLVRIIFSSEEINLLKKLSEEFKSKFKFDLDLVKYIKKDLLIRKASLPLIKKYLQKISPKIIIGVMKGSRWFPLEAAKHLGIPTIELQHGVIHQYHLLYSYRKNRLKRVFPDYFFTFGDYWRDSVSFPISKNNVVSVGYPYLEDEILKYKNVKKKNQIIFLSSVEIGKELSNFAFEFSKRKKTNFDVIIKLHPGEYHRWKSLYPLLINSPIIIIDNDEPPLYQLLMESKVQVGVNSTVIYEGIHLGLKTFLLDIPWIETMEYLIKMRLVKLINSVEQLELELLNLEENDVWDDSDYFFKKNASHNVNKQIKSIICAKK
jgi:hypothetical protein